MGRKDKLSPLLLAVLLGLSGCASMLERDSIVVTAHPEHPITDDSSVLLAENYQDLVNDVLYFVRQGTEVGSIRLTNYPQGRDVGADLSNACLEVARDAPLGAYAVEVIEHDYTRVVQDYEATIRITYRRSLEQMQGMKNVIGSSAIRRVLQEQLSRFSPEAVLQVAYFTEDENYIASLIRQAYYDTPAAALGMPQYTITLYPDAGRERIVEIQLTYPEPADTLRSKRQQLIQRVEVLRSSFHGLTGQDAALAICGLLRQCVQGNPGQEEGASAYHVLLEGQGDSEGMALAFRLLCQSEGLDAWVVQGVRDGSVHFWNVFALGDGQYRHVDASSGDALLLTDSELEALGYSWDRDAVFPCVSPEGDAPPETVMAQVKISENNT
ncbi:transglutaminase domain-containing protein [Pseudoflavonifractor sp. 524-17]|uniref:transglutaminase-like domain-containing protein n=1 Tax=Pseudoflavonifractor sp. 524-17 TaxID=2304577 RepID=UPI00137A050F|nr:transglutaminase domain-containing protein [Pseudoflavonifractor sp. 524-17]NCE63526.1 transglutaminase domain-containing protein [Pseudoflavonifractor sp. 524-17]